jgi:hypothetical protein
MSRDRGQHAVLVDLFLNTGQHTGWAGQAFGLTDSNHHHQWQGRGCLDIRALSARDVRRIDLVLAYLDPHPMQGSEMAPCRH